MKSNLSSVYALVLLLGDFVAIMGAFTAAYILRVTLSDGPFIAITANEYAQLFALLSPLWLAIFAFLGLYHRDVYEWRLKEFGRLFVGCGVGIMAMITYEFIINKPIFPARIVAVYAFIIGYLLLVFVRTILRSGRLIARHFGYGIVSTLVIGDGKQSRMLMESLRSPRSSGYQVVATMMTTPPPWSKGKNFTNLEKALASIEELGIHNIILTRLYDDPKINEEILAAANENHCGFRFIPGQEDLLSGSTEVELFQGMPVVYVHPTPLNGWSRLLKRGFDIVSSLLALILFSPIMLIIYIALLCSGGKPIYRRKRLTRYGNSFDIYKFRSLKNEFSGIDPEAGFAKLGRPELAKEFRKNGDMLNNDPRISRLGNIIRPTSLDELPQLFNVLKGDISLVGPRALVAEELNQYPQKNLILSIKSGLTGLAVISGRRDIPFEERRKLDLYYVQNWSFWLDIKIIVRTISEVLSRRGTA